MSTSWVASFLIMDIKERSQLRLRVKNNKIIAPITVGRVTATKKTTNGDWCSSASEGNLFVLTKSRIHSFHMMCND